METRKNSSIVLKIVTLALLLITLFSCREADEDAITEQEEVQIASESSSSESLTDEEIMAIEEELVLNPEGGRVSSGGCAVVTRDEAAKTITLDFGSGCIGAFGRERSGKIVITYGGEFGDNLANRVISFDNYYVNDKGITGTIELRDFNTDASGNLTATRKRNDLTVHFPGGTTFTSNGSVTITWLEGQGDSDTTNDILQITGSYTGVSSRGRTVTHTITEPIVVNFACYSAGGFARTDGRTELRISGVRERVRVVDFGDGTCDGTITVSINGKVHTITLS